MKDFGTFMVLVICIALCIFLMATVIRFFQSPIVVSIDPTVIRIKINWADEIEAGYYYLGEKTEKKVTYETPPNSGKE